MGKIDEASKKGDIEELIRLNEAQRMEYAEAFSRNHERIYMNGSLSYQQNNESYAQLRKDLADIGRKYGGGRR